MKQLPEVKFNNELILTTDQLATFYGTTPKRITDNFNANKDKFVEGTHYFHIEGSQLKFFKDQTRKTGLVNEHASSINLWTKRGASRHSKMLGTDQAWDRLRHRYLKVVGQYKWFVWMVNRGGAEMQLN